MGWLIDYSKDIETWYRFIIIAAAARYCVRMEGIHTNIVGSFEEAIGPIKMGFEELQFADRVSIFLLEQSKGIKLGDRFIGSTEVIESIFGKIKYMEHEQTAFGFTSLVIGAIASVGPTDEETIADAIKSIKQSDIDNLKTKEIGMSVQSQRRKLKTIIVKLKNEMEQKASGILEKKTMGF